MEDVVNEKIDGSLPVYAFVAPLEQASKIGGWCPCIICSCCLSEMDFCRRFLSWLAHTDTRGRTVQYHAVHLSVGRSMLGVVIVPVPGKNKNSIREHGKRLWYSVELLLC